jgi:hypothetical protein
LLEAAAEIADLIERIPCGHLQGEFAANVRNSHGDLKEMFGRFGERDFVLNRRVRLCGGEREEKKYAKRTARKEADPSLRSE